MLAKKHYAQRGHSSGAMNTRAVSQHASSVGRLNSLRMTPVYKPLADTTCSEYIRELEYDAIKCNPGPQATSAVSCPPSSSNCKVVPAIHKDTNHTRTAGEQIQHTIITRACFETDPEPTNNVC